MEEFKMKTILYYGEYENIKKQLGEKTYFEFEVQYEKCERELDRFLWESRKEMAQFKNQYKGPVVVDLSKWNTKQDKPFFEAFLYFLKDNVNQLTFIIDNYPSKSLLLRLERHFNIQLQELPFMQN